MESLIGILPMRSRGACSRFSVGSQAVLIETQVCPKAQTLYHDTTLSKKDPSRLDPNSGSSKAPRDQSEDHQHSLCKKPCTLPKFLPPLSSPASA